MSGNTSATGGYLVPIGAAVPEDDALADLLQTAVAGITGITGTLVRPRWQSSPPPQPPVATTWAAIGVTAEVPDDGPYIAHDGAADGGLGLDRLQRHIRLDVLVTFYGPAAQGMAGVFRDGVTIQQNLEVLAMSNIVHVAIGEPIHVPELISAQWIARVDVPWTLRRQVDRTYQVRNLASAEGFVNDQPWEVES